MTVPQHPPCVCVHGGGVCAAYSGGRSSGIARGRGVCYRTHPTDPPSYRYTTTTVWNLYRIYTYSAAANGTVLELASAGGGAS